MVHIEEKIQVYVHMHEVNIIQEMFMCVWGREIIVKPSKNGPSKQGNLEKVVLCSTGIHTMKPLMLRGLTLR